jgi:Flp pilus assembly pilin Flp
MCASQTRRRNVMKFINNTVNHVRALVKKDEGQDLLEYALLIALIALVAVGGVTLAGQKVDAVFRAVVGSMPSA